MPFTNLWDDVFPPDTQLANQLGLDLRNFRLDAQQRMAAISGLDAAKPAFGADAQPANWNGILFFATDTGKIYQFANPVWVDVTGNFQISGPRRVYQNGNLILHTGDVAIDTIYNFSLGSPLTAGQSLRVTFSFLPTVQGAPVTSLLFYMNAGANLFNSQAFGASQANVRVEGELLICAITTTTASYFLKLILASGTILVGGTFPNGGGYPDLTIKAHNGTASDSQSFGPILAEVI
jgi:hypothetical protein